MTDDALEYANFAVLNDAGQVIEVEREAWEGWRLSHPTGKLIRREQVESWTIITVFTGVSTVMDGPPCYWTTTATHPLLAKPVERSFATKEQALLAHSVGVMHAKASKFKRQLGKLFGTA
jgi:hypothetical protein